MANTKITLGNIANDAVGIDQLNISNDPSNGQALTYGASSNDLQWATVGVTGIDSSADATAITIDSSERVAIGSSTANKIFNIADPNQGGETLKLHFEAESSSDKFAIYSYDRTNGHYANMSLGQNAIWINGADANIGIGTQSPSKQLEIRNNTATTGQGGAELRLTRGDSSGASGDPIGTIEFYNTDLDGAHVSSFVKGIAQEQYSRQGALTFGTAGTNSTDATEKLRIQSGGGISFNGDTATANALDDYEEGTWTPTYSSNVSMGTVSGITGASGDYVKIGQMVHLRGQFTLNGSSGTRIDPGDCVRITGLPYKINDRKASGTVYTTRAFTNTGGFTGAAYWYASSYAVIQFLGQGSTVWSGDQNQTVYFSMNFRDINN